MTPERALGPGLRGLLAVLGAAALVAGVLAGAVQLRSIALGAPPLPALALALACAVAVAGGLRLLRGAVRGRIVVRRTRFRPHDR